VEAPELDGSKVQIPLAVVDFDEACGASNGSGCREVWWPAAYQALEAGGARTILHDDFFFRAPQLKRDPLGRCMCRLRRERGSWR